MLFICLKQVHDLVSALKYDVFQSAKEKLALMARIL
jgi:hypothetical protein